MKRELKFRAWDGQRMHYPKDGQYMAFFSAPNQVAWRLYERNGEGYVCDAQYGGKAMQSTGLKDKDGREIYDGDIVSVSGMYDHETGQTETDLCEVRYNGPSLMYVEIDGSDETSVESLIGVCSQDEDAEVVGNIYENPELLKP